jgi:hypothetical protein
MRLSSAWLAAGGVALVACTNVLGKFTVQEGGAGGGSSTANGSTANTGSASTTTTTSTSTSTSTSSTGVGGAGGGNTMPQWSEVAKAGTGMVLGPNSYVAASPFGVYFANGSQGTDRFFAFFEAATAKVTLQKVMPVATNDFCACGLTASPQWSPYPSSSLYSFGNYAQRYIDLTWIQIGNYLDQRGEAATALLIPEVLIIGGRNPNNQHQDTVLPFDTKAGVFGSINKYPKYIWGPVSNACAANFNNKIYLFGGTVNLNEKSRAAVLDPVTNAWAKLPDVPAAADGCDATPGPGGKIYVSVGKQAVWIYDVPNNVWSSTFFPFPQGGKGWRIATAGGKVWALGDMPDGLVHFFTLN